VVVWLFLLIDVWNKVQLFSIEIAFMHDYSQ